MEDKKLLNNEELEKVSGGSHMLDSKVQLAFQLAESELESIIDKRADVNFRSNVNLMLNCCRQVLDGSISAEDALHLMQTYCNQINIDYRKIPQDVVTQLRKSFIR